MVAVFDDVLLTWKGEEYRIPGDQMMIAIGRIEDHVTLKELMESMSSGKPKFGKIASAYAAVLRLAGARVTDAEVYNGMFGAASTDDDGKNVSSNVVVNALNGLLQMMVPPDALKVKTVTVNKTGESERRPQSLEAAASSSQKRSRRHTAGT